MISFVVPFVEPSLFDISAVHYKDPQVIRLGLKMSNTDRKQLVADFLNDFEAAGGWVNRDLLALAWFEDMGYGAVALSDIPVRTSIRQCILTNTGRRAALSHPH